MIYLNRTDEPQVIRINAAKSDGSTSGKMYKDLVTADEAKNIAQATVDEALKNIDFETKTINGEEIKGTGNIDTLENYCYIDPAKWTLANISADATYGNAFYTEMLPNNDIKTVGHPDFFGGYKYLVCYNDNSDNKKMFIAEAKEVPFLDSTDRFGSLIGKTELRQVTAEGLIDDEIRYYFYYLSEPLHLNIQLMHKFDAIYYSRNGKTIKGAYGLNNWVNEDMPLILVYNDTIYRRYDAFTFDDEVIDDKPVRYIAYNYLNYSIQNSQLVEKKIHIRYRFYEDMEVQPPMSTDQIESTQTMASYNLDNSINDAGDIATPIYISEGTAYKCAHPAAGRYYSFVPYVNVNGRTDLCLDIDFHYDKRDTKDYDCRLHCTADGRLQTKTTGETEYRNLCRTTLNVRNLFDISQDDYDVLVAAGDIDNYTIYLVDGKHLYWKGEEIGKDGGSSTGGVTSLNGETGDIKLKTINGQSVIGEGNIQISGGGGTGSTGGAVTSVNGMVGDVVIDVPTKVSQLTNDSKYISSTGSAQQIWTGTQAQYEQITTKNKNTLYIVF